MNHPTMAQQQTTARASILFKDNYYADSQIVVNQGGTSSGKTHAIIQVLFCYAIEQPKVVITVVGQDIPNLKAGPMRDAQNVCDDAAMRSAIKSFNKSDRLYEFHNGSCIEFKSYSNAQDAKSGKRDYLFVNEANGLDYCIFTELALRTRKRIYIDYNPNSEFWVHDHLIGQPGVRLLISDHRHNPFLDDGMRNKIERLRTEDKERWKVYARGLTGKINEQIFDNWYICDAIPEHAALLAAGLDFGYSNDQTACLLVFKQSGELWLDELLYETGLTNTDISVRLINAGLEKSKPIIADSSEPKSIEELNRLGWRISGAKKGADSVKNSIDILKRYRINITRRSANLHNELKRYKWQVDKSGRVLNQPVDKLNHLVDALRYVALNKLNINGAGKVTSLLPRRQHASIQTGILQGII